MTRDEAPELVLFILDLERGKPVRGMKVTLFRAHGEAGYLAIHNGETGADGCLKLSGTVASPPGRFRVEYLSGAYFSYRVPRPTFPEICVDFTWDGREDLAMPLLLTAHGYTTYRGS